MASEISHSRESILKEVFSTFLQGCGEASLSYEADCWFREYYERRFDLNEKEVLALWSEYGPEALERVLLTGQKAADKVKQDGEKKKIGKDHCEDALAEVKSTLGSRWC